MGTIMGRVRVYFIFRKYSEPTNLENIRLDLIESVHERYWKLQHPSRPPSTGLSGILLSDVWTQYSQKTRKYKNDIISMYEETFYGRHTA